MHNKIIEVTVFSLIMLTIIMGLFKIGAESIDRCQKAGGSFEYCANI